MTKEIKFIEGAILFEVWSVKCKIFNSLKNKFCLTFYNYMDEYDTDLASNADMVITFCSSFGNRCIVRKTYKLFEPFGFFVLFVFYIIKFINES